MLTTTASSREGDRRDGAVHLLKTVPIPGTKANTTGGNMYVFDISFVDQATQTYYLADRSNAVVDVVDARTSQLITQISATPPFRGFTGNNATSGPNGVVAAFPWLFVTDADSRVVAIDLRNGKTVGHVSTDGAPGLRADELAGDPKRSDWCSPSTMPTRHPLATLISVNPVTGALAVAKRITFDKMHSGVDATNGAEQPVWDPVSRKFYLSIPQIGANAEDGAVIRINPAGMVEAQYPIEFCQPAGLTLGPNVDLLANCSTVFDTAGNPWDATKDVTAAPNVVTIDAWTGKIDAVVQGVGAGDEAWYNSGDGNYYSASSTSPLRPDRGDRQHALDGSGPRSSALLTRAIRSSLNWCPPVNVPAVTTGPLFMLRARRIRWPPTPATTMSSFRWVRTMRFPTARQAASPYLGTLRQG